MLGIMYVTGFLSLWIQNTAAASMMLPIVIALVKQLSRYNKAYSGPGNLTEPSGGAGHVNMGFSVATHESQQETKNRWDFIHYFDSKWTDEYLNS